MKYGYIGNSKYEPLSPWEYFWLSVLFSIPLIGFFFLIAFSFSSGNINRRNYARSFFCIWLIIIIVVVIWVLVGEGFNILSTIFN